MGRRRRRRYMAGTAELEVRILAGGTGSASGAALGNLTGFTLRNAGTFTWTAMSASGQVVWTGSGRFINEATGTFNLDVDAHFVTPGGSGEGLFDNAGTFRKTTSGTALFGQAQGVTFVNTGTVEVLGGVLQLGSSLFTATHTGTVTLSAGTTLALGGGTHALS